MTQEERTDKAVRDYMFRATLLIMRVAIKHHGYYIKMVSMKPESNKARQIINRDLEITQKTFGK